MAELQTRPDLIRALELAATRPQTAEEIFKQRVSFIMGMLKDNSTVSRARVTEVLAEQQGKPPSK